MPVGDSNFLGIGGSHHGIPGTKNPISSTRAHSKQASHRRLSISNSSQKSVAGMAPKQKKGGSPQSPAKHRKSGINFNTFNIKTQRTNRDSKKDKNDNSAMNFCYFRGHRIESPRLIKLKQQMTRDKNSKIKATLVESQGMSMAVRFLQHFKITTKDDTGNKISAGKRAGFRKCLSSRKDEISLLGSRDEVSHDVLKYLFRPEDDGPKNHDFFLNGAVEDCPETRSMMLGYKNIISDANRDVTEQAMGHCTVRDMGRRKRADREVKSPGKKAKSMAKLPGQGKSPPKSTAEPQKPNPTSKHWGSLATLMLGAKKDKPANEKPETPSKGI